MTVKDIMTLLESPDRVRVIKDGEEIYNQYFVAAVVATALAAGFTFVLYKVGEEMNMNRCGWR